MNEKIIKEYLRWKKEAFADSDIWNELSDMEGNEAKIEDAFYKDLAFGTGGLRGVIGAGTNRMNIYTVAKASQGVVDYITKCFPKEKWKIAISYDSRIKSDTFARVAAGVFAANGIHVFIYSKLMPTPCLSYAVRYLECAAGIMITASHNPSKYNGYKVYGADGCQITNRVAKDILSEIEKLDLFLQVRQMQFDEGIEKGMISYIPDIVYTAFIEEVKKESMLNKDDDIDKDVSIVYSPLNGTGLNPVLRVLRESGYTNITVVKEQEQPDGKFPTCPYPNPEVKEAMILGIEYAAKVHADLLLATDPDCDRVGIAVKDLEGKYVLLSGNETGILLLDYICSQRIKNNRMPKDPIAFKTIVTIDMAERIAKKYGVRMVNVLTGFKFIGEQIGYLEKIGKETSYIFGLEESYGYLSGSYVRDKDGVNAAFLICEMFAYYKTNGVSLFEKLSELYAEYGYCFNTLHSYEFEGASGSKKMESIMNLFRGTIDQIGEKKVIKCLDYSNGIDGLPKSNVMKFLLEENCSVVIRPSGTEPKLKIYLSITALTKEEAKEIEAHLTYSMEKYIF